MLYIRISRIGDSRRETTGLYSHFGFLRLRIQILASALFHRATEARSRGRTCARLPRGDVASLVRDAIWRIFSGTRSLPSWHQPRSHREEHVARPGAGPRPRDRDRPRPTPVPVRPLL